MDHQGIFTATVAHYLAPIRAYLEDSEVSEVMVNRADEIFIEKAGRLVRTPAAFPDEEAYEAAVSNILQFTGKQITAEQPLVDSRLPDGSRVHVAKAPCSRFGTAMTIRKFNPANLDVDWLVEMGTLSPAARDYLRVAILAERNVLVAGGTSSGKTSLLNALSSYLPDDQRIVVIEDSAELQLQKTHIVSLESRGPDVFGRGAVTIRDLFRSSLRLRPDRIIIGEVRGGEALEMIQAMTSGHGGSMGTLHANNPLDALNRLETLAMMSQVDLPLHALRAQIASAIDVIVQMSRNLKGRRQVTQIAEIDPINAEGRYVTRDLFRLQPDPQAGPDGKGMSLLPTGETSSMAGVLPADLNVHLTESIRPMFEMVPPDRNN